MATDKYAPTWLVHAANTIVSDPKPTSAQTVVDIVMREMYSDQPPAAPKVNEQQLTAAAQHAATIITDWTPWLSAELDRYMDGKPGATLATVVQHWYKRNFAQHFAGGA